MNRSGTLQAFYPALDLVLLVLLALSIRGLVRLVRAPLAPNHRGAPLGPGPDRTCGSRHPRLGRARRLAGLVFRVYLDVLVPVVILLRSPDLLGAGWPTLVRIDVGVALLVLVAIRLLDGAIRLARRYRLVERLAGRLSHTSVGKAALGAVGDGSIVRTAGR